MSLADKIKNKTHGVEPTTEPTTEPTVDNKTKGDEGEPTVEPESELTPAEAELRTKESYEDEIKKLREENAKRRVKEQEAKKKALEQADVIFAAEREQYQSDLDKLKAELESLKSKAEDETKVKDEIKKQEENAELQLIKEQLELLKEESNKAKAELEDRKQKELEEAELRRQAADNRFKALISDLPEDQHEFANAMFKGYSDPQEGLLAITKAKSNGLFGKKTIEVVNRVPDNTDTKTKTPANKKVALKEALKTRRAGLTPGSRLL